jgi:hypothetical protein
VSKVVRVRTPRDFHEGEHIPAKDCAESVRGPFDLRLLLLPQRFLLIELFRSSHVLFSLYALFRLGDVSTVDCDAGSGDEARFFRGQVGDEASDLRYVTHALQRISVLTNSACAELMSVAVGPG